MAGLRPGETLDALLTCPSPTVLAGHLLALVAVGPQKRFRARRERWSQPLPGRLVR